MNEKDVYGEIEKYRLLLQKYFEETLEPEERAAVSRMVMGGSKKSGLTCKTTWRPYFA